MNFSHLQTGRITDDLFVVKDELLTSMDVLAKKAHDFNDELASNLSAHDRIRNRLSFLEDICVVVPESENYF